MPSKLNPIRRRVDRNQSEIVRELRAHGCSVQHLHTIGKGCPDLLVGYDGRNYLIELKSPGGKLTAKEIEWCDRWSGQVAIAYNCEDILKLLSCKSKSFNSS